MFLTSYNGIFFYFCFVHKDWDQLIHIDINDLGRIAHTGKPKVQMFLLHCFPENRKANFPLDGMTF